MKKLFPQFSTPFALDWAFLLLRCGLGILMARHGYDKFQNLLAGSTDFPDPLGVGVQLSLGLTVFAEFFCSILLIFGAFTRWALVPLIFCVLVIVFSIHGKDGLDDKEHGLLYLVGYIVLFLTGAGSYSLDKYIYKEN